MVRKINLTVITVLALLAAMIILPQTAIAVTLKQQSVVEADTLKLGDVFQGLPSGHDRVLGLAPQPGQEMTLNARTLLRIALATDLPWRPATSNDHIVITRAASVVDRSMVENAVRAQIESEGAEGKFAVVIPDASAKFILPADVAPGLEITSFSMNRENGWFEATAAIPSAAHKLQTAKITGTAHRLVNVPVLRTAMKSGQIIGARDIDLIEIRQGDLRHDMIMDASELVGMTPRRLAAPGRPLNALDVESPQIISRGDTVTMLFRDGALTLTASGKALQNGSKGDLIRVTNNASNKTIEGFVTAEREVTVKQF